MSVAAWRNTVDQKLGKLDTVEENLRKLIGELRIMKADKSDEDKGQKTQLDALDINIQTIISEMENLKTDGTDKGNKIKVEESMSELVKEIPKLVKEAVNSEMASLNEHLQTQQQWMGGQLPGGEKPLNIKPPIMAIGDDPELFVLKYGLMCDANRWKNDARCAVFLNCIPTTYLPWYTNLQDHTKHDFGRLKTAFLERFGAATDTHKMEMDFHNMKAEESSSIKEYALKLQDMGLKLHKSAQEVIYQFQMGLKYGTYRQLTKEKLKTLEQAIKSAEDHEATQQDMANSMKHLKSEMAENYNQHSTERGRPRFRQPNRPFNRGGNYRGQNYRSQSEYRERDYSAPRQQDNRYPDRQQYRDRDSSPWKQDRGNNYDSYNQYNGDNRRQNGNSGNRGHNGQRNNFSRGNRRPYNNIGQENDRRFNTRQESAEIDKYENVDDHENEQQNQEPEENNVDQNQGNFWGPTLN